MFFYVGKQALGRLFPDDFKETIPEKAVALVMACIRDTPFFVRKTPLKIHNCLDEYAIDGTFTLLRFEGLKYSGIYEAMLNLIGNINQAPYHCRKWEENRRRWARKGW
jgi:hypothetical protein